MFWKNEHQKNGPLLRIVILGLVIALFIFCARNVPEREDEKGQGEYDHPASQVIEGFHLLSYYAGSISTAAEFVGYGCKKLGLSATLSDEELAVLTPNEYQIFSGMFLIVSKLT